MFAYIESPLKYKKLLLKSNHCINAGENDKREADFSRRLMSLSGFSSKQQS